MKKQIAVFLVCAVFLLSLVGCGAKYNEDDFIGKTSAESVNEFGSFDCIEWPAGQDGLYRNTQCGYTIKEPQKGYFGTSPEVLIFITFDENAIAIACQEGYRPGG